MTIERNSLYFVETKIELLIIEVVGHLSNAGNNFWSATTVSNNTQNAWNTNLNNGNTNNNNKTNGASYRVRCVRFGNGF
jgi:hypothetical protein